MARPVSPRKFVILRVKGVVGGGLSDLVDPFVSLLNRIADIEPVSVRKMPR